MTVYTYEVKVQSVGGSNKFHIDGYQQPSLALGHDITYRFDVSDSSNAGHVFQFSTTSDGTHGGGTALGSSDGYTTSGTAGSANAYVELDVTSSTASTLYYFCGSSGHTGMGGTAVTTGAEYVSASNVALRKPILGNSDSWGHYINQNLDTIAGKLPASFVFPTGTGASNQVILSDGSGGTSWGDVALTPEITGLTWYSDSGYSNTLSASEAINIDDATYLKVTGQNFGSSGVFGSSAYIQIINTTQSNAVVGNNQSGLTGCVTSASHQSDAEVRFTINPTGVSGISSGDTLKVKYVTGGGESLFTTGYVVSADPTSVTTVNSATISNTASVGSFGGVVAGGGQDSNTKLLLNFDRGGGTDIEDSSNTGDDGHKFTITNGAVIKASPFGDGKSAIYFNAVDGTEVKVASFNTGTGLGAGAFTLETWIWCEEHDSDSANPIIIDTRTGSNGFGLEMVKTSGQMFIWDSVDGSKIVAESADTLLPLKTWTHVAIVRTATGTPVKLYLNGKEAGASGNNSSNYSSETLTFGRAYNANGSNFKGYQDEIRVVVGTAVYTGNFTVPTSRLTAITNTKLLIHSNRTDEGNTTFTDSSSSSHSITRTGAIHSKLHGGIAPAMTWPASGKATGSAGMYFDGVNDFIETPPPACMTSSSTDTTIEFWFYYFTTGTIETLFRSKTIATSSAGYNFQFYIRTDGDLQGYLFNNTDYAGTSPTNSHYHGLNFTTLAPPNQWNHLAFTHDGSANTIRFYVNGKYMTPNDANAMQSWSTQLTGSNNNLCFGGGSGGGDDLQGYIDQVRVSDTLRYSGTDTTNFWSTTNGFSGSAPTQIYGAFKSDTIDTVTLTGSVGSGQSGYVTFNNATLSTDGNNTETTSALPAGLSLNEAESQDNTATITGDLTASAGSHAINLVARVTSDGTDAEIDPNRKQAYSHTITKGSGGAPVLFNARRYAGNSTNRSINGLGFKPDLVWIKDRDSGNHHVMFDSVRGENNFLVPNENVEQNKSTYSYGNVSDFNSDGFSLAQGSSGGGWAHVNLNTNPFVAWAWKAGGAVGSGTNATSNGQFRVNGETTDRTATSYSVTGSGYAYGKSSQGTTFEASYNVDSGFAIIKTTSAGSGSANQFPTFIGGPDVIIVKKLNSTSYWHVYHSSAGITNNHRDTLYLNANEADDHTNSTSWGLESTIGANSGRTFDLGSHSEVNASGTNDRYVYYLWKAVSGVSAFGSYSGSSSGGTVTGLGFKPRWVMIKSTTGGYDWQIYDAFRDEDDSAQRYLKSNSSDAEISNTDREVTFTSNGFTTDNYVSIGGNGDTYIYMAFA